MDFLGFPKRNGDALNKEHKDKQKALAERKLEEKFQEYFEEHFKIFCLYRFYNSHSKAMQMRQEELDLIK
jgi:hypothetical protein